MKKGNRKMKTGGEDSRSYYMEDHFILKIR